MGDLQSLKVSAHKTHINYKETESNSTVHELEKHHLNKVIKGNIIGKGANGGCRTPDRMQ